jgi:hypothetical protein
MSFGVSVGCGSSDPAPAVPPEPVPAAVEIGIPGGGDELGFVPLEPGGELRLQSFGQGGTHVLLGVRCIGFGNRAFVNVTLTNLVTGVQVFSPAPVRPQLLLCQDANTCDLVPLLAMTGGLTAMGTERHGVPVEISADVHNTAGAAASASVEAVLSTADL